LLSFPFFPSLPISLPPLQTNDGSAHDGQRVECASAGREEGIRRGGREGGLEGGRPDCSDAGTVYLVFGGGRKRRKGGRKGERKGGESGGSAGAGVGAVAVWEVREGGREGGREDDLKTTKAHEEVKEGMFACTEELRQEGSFVSIIWHHKQDFLFY